MGKAIILTVAMLLLATTVTAEPDSARNYVLSVLESRKVTEAVLYFVELDPVQGSSETYLLLYPDYECRVSFSGQTATTFNSAVMNLETQPVDTSPSAYSGIRLLDRTGRTLLMIFLSRKFNGAQSVLGSIAGSTVRMNLALQDWLDVHFPHGRMPRSFCVRRNSAAPALQ